MFEMTIVVVLVVAAFITATISGILGMAGGVTLLGVMTALLPAP
ncbi:MAG: sulfite exporter TauE/SafE family protein, partial [Deltaproteobacteria bacterium]|nr:sulfite exporter TauE/SafE family protein [Deltaproteobacteria bacterium]